MKLHRRYMWLVLGSITVLALVSAELVGLFTRTVPTEEVYGTYLATYPFGKDSIVLNRDGTLTQEVEITNDPPAVALKGTWDFDPKTGYVTLHDHLKVDDGFGKLNSQWRVPRHGFAASLPIERSIFAMTMGSGANYPYVKQ